jgi:hypothetical protein
MLEKHFPLTIVDDFLDDPDVYRELALSQETWNNKSNYPGKRSLPLHTIDKKLFDNLCNKVFSLWYDFHYHEVNWTTLACFQRIDKSIAEVTPWVHQDYDCIAAGIIYLNLNSPTWSGTSFFEQTKLTEEDETFKFHEKNLEKVNLGLAVDPELVKSGEKYRRGFFREDIKVGSKYNRLVAFGSHIWHTQTSFEGPEDEDRLTLVFFVNGLTAPPSPLARAQMT